MLDAVIKSWGWLIGSSQGTGTGCPILLEQDSRLCFMCVIFSCLQNWSWLCYCGVTRTPSNLQIPGVSRKKIKVNEAHSVFTRDESSSKVELRRLFEKLPSAFHCQARSQSNISLTFITILAHSFVLKIGFRRSHKHVCRVLSLISFHCSPWHLNPISFSSSQTYTANCKCSFLPSQRSHSQETMIKC